MKRTIIVLTILVVSLATFFIGQSLARVKQTKTHFAVNDKLFSKAIDKGQVERKLEEASALAVSFQNPGCYWTLNDSDNPAEVYLIDSTAQTKMVCKLQGIQNRDWEDIAIGPGPIKGKKYVYVGEIGDNSAVYDFKYIYRFEEPDLKKGAAQTITNVETLVIKLPDGRRDTEAMLIDPTSNDLYIISKREERVGVYFQKFPYPRDTLKLTKVLDLPFNWVTSGSISKDASEVLIKNYNTIFYWKRSKEKSIIELLKKDPVEIPYKPEPQGEAICFAYDNSGFYTISETRIAQPLAQLKFYKRLK
ncbi:MAG TPA: hypothetical protein DGG95_14140 [Cytophagales bacterium]|jgi:hypothetical protein|nr:hypothetical protein [Cytophagales bacterium]